MLPEKGKYTADLITCCLDKEVLPIYIASCVSNWKVQGNPESLVPRTSFKPECSVWQELQSISMEIWSPCPGGHAESNPKPGPSALRWLLGDDAADRGWGCVKITSQLIGYFTGKAVLASIYFQITSGHRMTAKISRGRGLSTWHVATGPASTTVRCCSFSVATQTSFEKIDLARWRKPQNIAGTMTFQWEEKVRKFPHNFLTFSTHFPDIFLTTFSSH